MMEEENGGGSRVWVCVCLYVRTVGVEVNVCVCALGVSEMEIRQNKQQSKHVPYIRGRRQAVTSACGCQIRPHHALCVRVSLCL